jgi:arginine kinase
MDTVNTYDKLYARSTSLAASVWRDCSPQEKSYLAHTTSQWGGGIRDMMCNSEVDAAIGLSLPDASTLERFEPLLCPLLEQFHGRAYDPSNHPNRLEMTSKDRTLDVRYCRSVRARLAYNLEDYPFGMKEEHFGLREAILDEVKEKLRALEGTPYEGTYQKVEDCTEEELEVMRSMGDMFQKPSSYSYNTGSADGWPAGQALYQTSTSVGAWIGEEDHLRLYAKENGGDITRVTQTVLDTASYLDSQNGWAREGNFFITTCPTNCGTGMRVSALLALPVAVATDYDTLKNIASQHHLQIRGVHGEHSEVTEGCLEVSFQYRMGYTVDEILDAIYEGASQMIAHEQSLGKFSTKVKNQRSSLFEITP